MMSKHSLICTHISVVDGVQFPCEGEMIITRCWQEGKKDSINYGKYFRTFKCQKCGSKERFEGFNNDPRYK